MSLHRYQNHPLPNSSLTTDSGTGPGHDTCGGLREDACNAMYSPLGRRRHAEAASAERLTPLAAATVGTAELANSVGAPRALHRRSPGTGSAMTWSPPGTPSDAVGHDDLVGVGLDGDLSGLSRVWEANLDALAADHDGSPDGDSPFDQLGFRQLAPPGVPGRAPRNCGRACPGMGLRKIP